MSRSKRLLSSNCFKTAQILNSNQYVNWDLRSYKAQVIKKEACGLYLSIKSGHRWLEPPHHICIRAIIGRNI